MGASLGVAEVASADPCQVAGGVSGTIRLPPDGCDYLSPQEVHLITMGLPPGTTIELAPIHRDFICGNPSNPAACSVPPPALCEEAGGSLAGNLDCFESTLEFQATGTGDLAGFSRLLTLPAVTEIHTAPRTFGDAVQDFDTTIILLGGEILPGDPDFAFLQIRAGDAFGLPSPGHTTLTRLGGPGSDFSVDSFFDITYEIEFIGAPGSALDGFSGTTTGTITMRAGEPSQPVGVVPTLPQWGLVTMGLLLLTAMAFALYKRRPVSSA